MKTSSYLWIGAAVVVAYFIYSRTKGSALASAIGAIDNGGVLSGIGLGDGAASGAGY